MELFLVRSSRKKDLKKIYERAFSEATELYILSAYLTSWEFNNKLNPRCNKFRLIVGTDFGITREKALEKALKWLPSEQKCNFLAVDNASGFHPKVAFWKTEKGQYYCVIGSSNQTNAAFNTNYEANAVSNITSDEFEYALDWIQDIEKRCNQVNEYWIKQYKESEPTSKKKVKNHCGKKKPKAYDIEVPVGFDKLLLDRKEQMKAYTDIRNKFIILVKECASGRLSNEDFYKKFRELWRSNHYVSFQSDGWTRKGKVSNFSEVCISLVKAQESEVVDLDDIVKIELDGLQRSNNPARRSLFTEFLCKEFPDQFPVWNAPIERYLKSHHLDFPRTSSFGSKYIHMAREMRKIVEYKNLPIENLAELDLLIGLQQGWN